MIFPPQLDGFLSSTGENLPRLIQRFGLLLFSVVLILGIVFVELQIPAKKASFLFPFFFSRSVQNLRQRTPRRNLTSHRALPGFHHAGRRQVSPMVEVERCCSANEASFGKDGHCWRGWPLKMIRCAQLNLSSHGMGRQFRLTCVWSSPQPGSKLASRIFSSTGRATKGRDASLV